MTTQGRQPGVVDGAGRLDELFGPGYGFVIFDHDAKQRRVRGNGSSHVEVAPVGGPPKRGPQVASSTPNQSYASRCPGCPTGP